jgi:hypothetical protein
VSIHAFPDALVYANEQTIASMPGAGGVPCLLNASSNMIVS